MLVLQRKLLSEIANEYPYIFNSVFGEWTYEGNCPSEVYLGYEDNQLIGFISGYTVALNTWYIQRAGFISDLIGDLRNIKRAAFVIDKLHNVWPHLLTLIRNDDYRILRMAITLGFVIIGTRLDVQKRLWVEMRHSKEEKSG